MIDDNATPGEAVTEAPGGGRRILMVAPQPFFRVTGTPLNILQMCRSLTESGFAVDLLTLPYGTDVDLPNLTVHRMPKLPLLNGVGVGFSAAKLLYNPLLACATLALLVRARFAAVHAIEEAAFYVVPLARLFGVPAITDLDSDLSCQLRESRSLLARLLARPAGWLRRMALRRSAGALSVARHMSDIARTDNPRLPVFEVKDIPLESAMRAPDAERMATYRRALGLEGRRLVVYTGNYDQRQGLEELVHAVRAVRERHPDAVLLVIGGDAKRMLMLRALVDTLGLGTAVTLLEPQPAESMAEYMGMADVLVSPRLEPHATPLKIFSYMASGRPIVATELPTHTQVLDGDAAFLVAPTSAGLAGGIITALDDPVAAAQRGARARRLVEERHTYGVFKRQLVDAYTAILDGRPATPDAAAEAVVAQRSGSRAA